MTAIPSSEADRLSQRRRSESHGAGLLGALSSRRDPALARMEADSERLIAGLRITVFVLVAAIFWWTGAIGQDHAVLFSLAGFGLATAISAAVVLAGWMRPWMAWVFATFDVGLLIHCLGVYAVVMHMPVADMLSVPGSWLIFLYVAMAAMRYRPYLVLYTGALFALGWAAVWALARATVPEGTVHAEANHVAATLAGEIARFVVILVTVGAMLAVTVRTRHSILAAVQEARKRANLSRYFARSLVGELAGDGQAGRMRLQRAAVAFIDIRGFTALAERMSVAEVAAFLNEYRRRLAKPIAAWGGTIDKYIGDGMMVVFGVPHPDPDDARKALGCVLAVRSAIAAWNAERRLAGEPVIEVAIGLHMGEVMAGALDDGERLEFTVIGDTVNVANRLERQAAALDRAIVVSAELLMAAGEADSPGWELVGDMPLRGRIAPIRLFARTVEPEPYVEHDRAPRHYKPARPLSAGRSRR